MPETPQERHQRQVDETLRRGFRIGVEPVPAARQIGPAGLSTGAISTEEQERRRRAKAAAGVPLTQEDLQ